jgi:hypothetical protein
LFAKKMGPRKLEQLLLFIQEFVGMEERRQA